MKVKIKSYSGKLYCLTLDKEYTATPFDDGFFTIKADNGAEITCRFVQCYHLNGGSWEIVTKSHTSQV